MMQVPGEHASCGPRLEPSGFTYDPKDFMDAGVFFYNFGWKDYHEASMANILDMVKVLSFALSEGKVSMRLREPAALPQPKVCFFARPCIHVKTET